MMYSEQERARIRAGILERAGEDERISGAAITGSGADGREDAWSDVDLAFGVRAGVEMTAVLADWTTYLYGEHGALHHLDVLAGPWTYRVFLLSNTLQVDLAFVTETEFRALAPTFRLVFGESQAPGSFPAPTTDSLTGFGWLYAIHARSCIARGKVWQAEYMISGVRDTALALACLRHGLSAVHGRGLDELPGEVTGAFEAALVCGLTGKDLMSAFGTAVERLMEEVRLADSGLAERIVPALAAIRANENAPR